MKIYSKQIKDLQKKDHDKSQKISCLEFQIEDLREIV